mmetsp:Transcript_33660/g.107242  ORF Transcript_33660/g.107242 Transcript_33660/m.107242 type:complete len:259 (-) Transcript_33660:4534-5310(-)
MTASSGCGGASAQRASCRHRRAESPIACNWVTSLEVTRSSSASRRSRWSPPNVLGETPRSAARSTAVAAAAATEELGQPPLPPLPGRSSVVVPSAAPPSPDASPRPSAPRAAASPCSSPTSASSIATSCGVSGSSSRCSPFSTARARACHNRNCDPILRSAARASGSTSHASPAARAASSVSYRNLGGPPSPPPLSAASSSKPTASTCHASASSRSARNGSTSGMRASILAASSSNAATCRSRGRRVRLGTGKGGPYA